MRSIVFALLLCAWVVGCDAPRSRLHGVVTYKGKTVGGAVVTFFADDNSVHNATTAPDGTYSVTGVPRGQIRVSVQLDTPRPRPRPDPDLHGKAGNDFGREQARAEDSAKMARLPEPPPIQKAAPTAGLLPAKYADPKASGLSLELKDAEQEFRIELN